jgi:hypothetical protein
MALRRFKVLCQADPPEYQPATVHLRVKPKPDGRSKTPPEIDAASGITFKVWSCTENQQSDEYLQFSNQQVSGNRMTFTVEPDDKLLWREDFDHVVSDDFRVTVTVKVKGAKDGQGKPLSTDFLVKVGSAPVIIHWQWDGYAIGYPMRSGVDSPIELQADGKSWFHLKVRAQEWDKKQNIWQDADTNKYEFTHWVARGDLSINTSIFEPDPSTWDDSLKGSTQAENDWYSRRELPSPPDFSHMPVKTDLDVKAFTKGTIQQRLVDDVLPHVSPLGEVLIPVHLVRYYTLSLAVYLEGDDEPLALPVDVTVNGEKVKVFCPNLIPSMLPDLMPKLRWHVKWPDSVPPSKRNFRLIDQDDDLVRVTSPRDGQECLGVEISIVDDPCSEADPPVFLDVRAPEFEIVVKFDPEKKRKARSGLELLENEFVADAWDSLKFSTYVHRKGHAKDAVFERASVERVEIRGTGCAKYDLDWHDTSSIGCKVSGEIRAHNPLLYTADNVKDEIRLYVEAKAPDYGRMTSDSAFISLEPSVKPLKPRFVYVKLWVAPGGRPGTSEAGAFVRLAPDASAIRPQQQGQTNPVFLPKFEPLAGAHLNLKVESEHDVPRLVGGGFADTDKDGTARWLLDYSGLTWDNLTSARFKVKCGPRPPDRDAGYETTSFQIDVRQNVRDMLEAFNEQAQLQIAGELDLTNREDWYILQGPFRSWKGPYYNIRSFAGQGSDDYTCNNLRERISSWLKKRRFVGNCPDVSLPLRMNGIDIASFQIAPIHVFAGFHLSGTPPNDAYFFDPWWEQEWGERSIMQWNTEYARLSTFVMAAVPVLGPFMIKTGLAAGIAGARALIVSYLWKGALVGGVTLGLAHLYDMDHFVMDTDPVHYIDPLTGNYVGYHKNWLDWFIAPLKLRGTVPYVEPLEMWN